MREIKAIFGYILIIVILIFAFKLVNYTILKTENSALLKENAKFDNTIKTQSKAIKDLKADKEALVTLTSAKVATINKNTALIGKLKTSLINSQEYSAKLKAKLIAKSSRKSIRYKPARKTYKRKITKKAKPKVKTESLREKKIKRYNSEKLFILKKIGSSKKKTGLYRELMLAKQVIGRKKRKSAVSKVEKKIKSHKRKIVIINYKIKNQH